MKEILDIDPNEQVMFRVKQHSIIMYQILAGAVFVIAMLMAGFIIAVNSDQGGAVVSLGKPVLALLTFLGILLVMGFSWIAIWIHRASELIVTNENVIQKLQQSLFSTRVSQLNLSKVQDVTVNKHGIIASILDMGTIDIESAGEASNYHFRFAPNPNQITLKPPGET